MSKSTITQLNFVTNQLKGPVDCLGLSFPSDEARRQYFREKLREKLKDPAFRKIDGFPIGEEEDILALSDPPYYTACPNPFLSEVISDRFVLPLTDNPYHREPYAFDVSEGKGDQSYYIHSYHTKVPPSAIAKYISHYADANSVILDCFSGSGMTGLGASLATQNNLLTILLDLSPAATFISYFHNCFRPQPKHFQLIEELLESLRVEFDAWYGTPHSGWAASTDAARDWQTRSAKSRGTGRTRFVVWSTIVACPECGHSTSLWDLCVDLHRNTSADVFDCPSCDAVLVKERKFAKKHNGHLVQPVKESFHDLQLGKTIQRVKRAPVLVSYEFEGTRYEKPPGPEDLENIRLAESKRTIHWCPTDRMPEGDESRRNDEAGLTHSHHFFPARTLHVLASAWDFLCKHDPGLRGLVTGILTRSSWQNRYMPQHRGNRSREVVGPLSGTLYVPYFSLEINPVEYLYEKGKSALRSLSQKPSPKTFISTHSASSISSVLPEKSIDYSFIDPPFGSNLQYAELSFIMECWFKVRTASTSEAVVNVTRNVGIDGYSDRMRQALSSLANSLKPGRWVTLEFHNSQNAIWSAIQVALNEAGMIIADVRTLDKKKGTTKQLTSANAVQQDLVITAYRPTEELETLLSLHAGDWG
jgi:16S rRNA G966 N2-methylase RsmD